MNAALGVLSLGEAGEFFEAEASVGFPILVAELPFEGDPRLFRAASSKANALPPVYGKVEPARRVMRLSQSVTGGLRPAASVLLEAKVAAVADYVRLQRVMILDYARLLRRNFRRFTVLVRSTEDR